MARTGGLGTGIAVFDTNEGPPRLTARDRARSGACEDPERPARPGPGRRPRRGPALAPPDQAGIDELKKTAVKVFLDCDYCDLEYIKTEITFVNYVRDRLEAQVHILITHPGDGRRRRRIHADLHRPERLQGRQGPPEVLSRSRPTPTTTSAAAWSRPSKLGLMSFVGRTPIARPDRRRLYARPRRPAAARDRWNSWVFSLSGRRPLHRARRAYQEPRRRLLLSRPTGSRPESKVRLGLSVDTFEARNTSIEDGDRSPAPTSRAGTRAAFTSRAWASTGRSAFFLEAESSLYSNIDLGLSVAPAVEYNVFPYSQSTRRQLRALYTLAVNPVRYREETIYGKTRETLFKEELSADPRPPREVRHDQRQRRGLELSPRLQQVPTSTLFGIVNLRLYKGLQRLRARRATPGSTTQLSLLGREPTYEELLLRLRELPMTSNHFVAVGFQFQFGSIFTNVINPALRLVRQRAACPSSIH
ncbi:MAG: hypothetical protein MZW92_10205 [Comamonadaceae bacterium]|nr:hypothetical protein [Comamonadaceae bacterium]